MCTNLKEIALSGEFSSTDSEYQFIRNFTAPVQLMNEITTEASIVLVSCSIRQKPTYFA